MARHSLVQRVASPIQSVAPLAPKKPTWVYRHAGPSKSTYIRSGRYWRLPDDVIAKLHIKSSDFSDLYRFFYEPTFTFDYSVNYLRTKQDLCMYYFAYAQHTCKHRILEYNLRRTRERLDRAVTPERKVLSYLCAFYERELEASRSLDPFRRFVAAQAIMDGCLSTVTNLWSGSARERVLHLQSSMNQVSFHTESILNEIMLSRAPLIHAGQRYDIHMQKFHEVFQHHRTLLQKTNNDRKHAKLQAKKEIGGQHRFRFSAHSELTRITQQKQLMRLENSTLEALRSLAHEEPNMWPALAVFASTTYQTHFRALKLLGQFLTQNYRYATRNSISDSEFRFRFSLWVKMQTCYARLCVLKSELDHLRFGFYELSLFRTMHTDLVLPAGIIKRSQDIVALRINSERAATINDWAIAEKFTKSNEQHRILPHIKRLPLQLQHKLEPKNLQRSGLFRLLRESGLFEGHKRASLPHKGRTRTQPIQHPTGLKHTD
ncbi:hypothetical protein DPSP01_013703 [Paraphaeosphaeria sporulosa]